MSNIFITSDTHFGHDRDFIYAPRGYSSELSASKAIVANINCDVKKDDELYILGDVLLGSDDSIDYLNSINCKNIHIIAGNHDSQRRIDEYRKCLNVVEVCESKRISDGAPYKESVDIRASTIRLISEYYGIEATISGCQFSYINTRTAKEYFSIMEDENEEIQLKIMDTTVNSTGKATTDGYGLTKLSTSTSSTSTALAATSSAVKTAYDKAKSAFSGKGLPWAVFSITDDVHYTAWSEQAPSLTLRSSYSGDRTSTFSHGGAFYIYCPYAGRVEINFNLYVGSVSSNGYLYARCYGYQYASDGSNELLDFTGMGAVTSSGSQANGTLVAEVKAGKYIYIVFCSTVAGKTNSASNPTNYKVRLQYRNIYD